MKALTLQHSSYKVQQAIEVWQCQQCGDRVNKQVTYKETETKDYQLTRRRCATCRFTTAHELWEIRLLIGMRGKLTAEMRRKLEEAAAKTPPMVVRMHDAELTYYELWRCELCGADTYYEVHDRTKKPRRFTSHPEMTHDTESWQVRIRTDGFSKAFNVGMKEGVKLVKARCLRLIATHDPGGEFEQRRCTLRHAHTGSCE